MKELREAEGDQENRKERDRKRIHLGFGCTFSVVMAARWEGEEERVIGQCEGPTTVGRQQPRRGGRSRGEGRTCGTTRADARHVSESTADTRGLFNPTLEHSIESNRSGATCRRKRPLVREPCYVEWPGNPTSNILGEI